MKKILLRNLPSYISILQLSIDFLAAAIVLFTLSASSRAQDEHLYTFQIGGGVSPLVGDISTRLDTGWHVTVGGGVKFNNILSATLDYTRDGYGVTDKVLMEAQAPAANSHLWSITVNPRLRLMHGKGFVPYLTAGVGYYRRTVQVTQPAAVPVLIFDPFFGLFYNTTVQVDQVLGNITQGGVGGSAGGGFEIKLGDSGLKVFTEARYHYADTGRIPTQMVPVTFGLRW
jgi:hypothetical protein